MKFNWFKRKPSLTKVDTLISPTTTIVGDINFTGGLRVEGSITGNVSSSSEDSIVVLVKGGRIGGSIKSAHAQLDSAVEGPLVICQELELLSNYNGSGEITYASLKMHHGAVHRGHLNPLNAQILSPGEARGEDQA